MKTLPVVLTTLGAVLCAPWAHAQDAHSEHRKQAEAAQPAQPPSPYAGMQSRPIKALSARQVADLREGKGMSLALPAELNGYPGPSHTLELANQLELSDEQTLRVKGLFAQMKQEAMAAGEAVIEAEQALDELFKNRQATPDALKAVTARAALAQGQLRESHLRYHLAVADVLSPGQIATYTRLRGN
ncbi:Spy/CpxP family protein refolding chaperone [Variovorax sp.]|uniref:Spy/CpxP family protein refolding chaperone n=1 Tax=Variovorax sp. TaxID=1871043 RepID=UPI003BAAB7AD